MIDLYTFVTPNGWKASIMLEETGLPYTTKIVHLGKGEQRTPEFLSINPNAKIPAIVDHDGPGGRPISVFESGAILIYLADKAGALLATDGAARYAALEWLMFQMSAVGPIFGQLDHFVRSAKEKVPYAIERFSAESARILRVLEQRLGEAPFLAGDYSIADIATYPWMRVALPALRKSFADKLPSLDNVDRWMATVASRPAVQRGLAVPKLG